MRGPVSATEYREVSKQRARGPKGRLAVKKHSRSKGWTMGLDLGDRFSQVCVLDAAGEVEARVRVATTVKGLEAALRRYAGARVVLEVGTHSPWVSHWLEEQGYEAIVANPRRLRSITQSDRKDDRTFMTLLAKEHKPKKDLVGTSGERSEAAKPARTDGEGS